MQQLSLSVSLNDEATFDSFFVSDGNRLSVNTLNSSLRHEADAMLYLFGSAGSGRSHLLQALCHFSDVNDMSVAYMPLAEMQLYMPNEVFDGLETQQLICLDDIDSIAGNSLWETEIFNLYNRVLAAGGHLIVAASAAPKATAFTLPDLQSRLSQFLVLKLQDLSDSEKQQALQHRAKLRGMQLDDDVAQYMLRYGKRDMHHLIAGLDLLDKASLTQKRKITVPLAREVLLVD